MSKIISFQENIEIGVDVISLIPTDNSTEQGYSLRKIEFP